MICVLSNLEEFCLIPQSFASWYLYIYGLAGGLFVAGLFVGIAGRACTRSFGGVNSSRRF